MNVQTKLVEIQLNIFFNLCFNAVYQLIGSDLKLGSIKTLWIYEIITVTLKCNLTMTIVLTNSIDVKIDTLIDYKKLQLLNIIF